MSDLLASLRREQMQSRYPDQHVFRITCEQEREIIDAAHCLAFDLLDPHHQPKHIASLFGCKVEVQD